MHEKIFTASLLATQFLICQIAAAPNCDLRTIFRTPRDFDQFELIERSNFEQDKTQDVRLKEDTKPYANAQILLRIGCDKETGKKSEEPCIPLSQLLHQNVLQKETTPQFHPAFYQQHLNPYHPQVPFAFPHCLYYDALGALCNHFLPLVKEVLGEHVKAKTLQGTIAGNKPEQACSEEVEDAIKLVDEISLNSEDPEKDCAEVDDAHEVEPETTAAENELTPSKHDLKKTKDGKSKDGHEHGEKKTSKRHTNKKSNIQKIPADGKVHTGPLLEEGSNEVLVPVGAIQLQELRMSVKKDDADNDKEQQPKKKRENSDNPDLNDCKVSLDVLKMNKSDENATTTNSTDTAKRLDEALIPVSCLSCNNKKEVKNAISYPIFNKESVGDDENSRIEVGNCGCLDTAEKETNATIIHHPFTVDIDDLNLMHGEPVAQSSIIRNMAPKFLRNIVAAKTLAHYLPFMREEPKIHLVPYKHEVENVRLIPHDYQGCTCKHCLYNVHSPTVQEEQPRYLLVEQPCEEEVVRVVPSFVHRPSSTPLPSYLSRQMSRPLAIYETAAAEDSQGVLVPVEVHSQGAVTGRCASCAPYCGELNES